MRMSTIVPEKLQSIVVCTKSSMHVAFPYFKNRCKHIPLMDHKHNDCSYHAKMIFPHYLSGFVS